MAVPDYSPDYITVTLEGKKVVADSTMTYQGKTVPIPVRCSLGTRMGSRRIAEVAAQRFGLTVHFAQAQEHPGYVVIPVSEMDD